jgi:hypothetical protein
MSIKKIFGSINITSGSSLTATNTSHTLGNIVCATNGNVGIGTTAPLTALHVNGTISQGGYASLGLSVALYSSSDLYTSNPWPVLQFGNTEFANRITNNTSSVTLQDPGIYLFVLKLNSDVGSGLTGILRFRQQYYNGTSWVDYYSSEQFVTYTGQTEILTSFLVNSSANQQWRIIVNTNNQDVYFSTATGPAYWSRLMISKVG